MKNVKSFKSFLKESLSTGEKSSPRWKNFMNILTSMVPEPEIIESEPSDPLYKTLSWGLFLDPSKKYGVAISPTTPDFPQEQIVFGIEDRDLAERIKEWWERKGYQMNVGNIPASGDNPEDIPSVPISFDNANEIKKNLTDLFKEIPF